MGLSETAVPAPVAMGDSKFLFRPSNRALRSPVERARLEYEPKVGGGRGRNKVVASRSKAVCGSEGAVVEGVMSSGAEQSDSCSVRRGVCSYGLTGYFRDVYRTEVKQIPGRYSSHNVVGGVYVRVPLTGLCVG